MQELEKILEEIEQKKEKCLNVVKMEIDPMEITIHREQYKGLCMAEKSIRKHMNDGWIPVNDRLPEEPPEEVDDEDNLEEYIVMIEGAEKPTTLQYAGDGTWWKDGTYYPVIAWQPLPEHYKPPVESAEEKSMREREEFFSGNDFLTKRFMEVR